MRRYVVRRQYESHVGQYTPGQVLVLDDETAAWLLRDMPGVIEEAITAPTPAAPVVEVHMIETPGPEVEVHVARPARKGRGRK